jgi:hypothetical protein
VIASTDDTPRPLSAASQLGCLHQFALAFGINAGTRPG